MPPEPVSSADPAPPAPAATAEAQPAADSRRVAIEHVAAAARTAELAHSDLTDPDFLSALAEGRALFALYPGRVADQLTSDRLQRAHSLLSYALRDLDTAIRLFGAETPRHSDTPLRRRDGVSGLMSDSSSLAVTRAPSPADAAVDYLLKRMRADGRLAWLIGPGSQSYELLTAAYAELHGLDVQGFRNRLFMQLTPIDVRAAE